MGSIFKDNQAYENNEERFKELEARKYSIQDARNVYRGILM